MRLRTLLAGAAFAMLAAPAAHAADARDMQIQSLENQLQDLAKQIQALKAQQAQDAANQKTTSDQVQDLKRSAAAQAVPAAAPAAAAPVTTANDPALVTFANGTPTLKSADGQFTAQFHALGQFDTDYYMQGGNASKLPAAYGPDLASGSNFRRAYIGVAGTAYGDWSYNANFDFGGSSGTETQGRVQSLFAQYDGVPNWHFRVGAFPPPANFEDSTSAYDTIFLERNSPSDTQRNIAGGDGRDAATILYTGPTVFAAASVTGGKVADAAVNEEQKALLGRAAWLVESDADSHLAIGANGTYVISPPQATINGLPTLANTPGGTAFSSLTLKDPPELTADSNGTNLVTTGALPASHLTQWGLEAAGNFQNFYGQGGYYSYQVERTPQAYKAFTSATKSATQIVDPSNNDFSGWYLQGTWTLTGESRNYNPNTGAFTPPRPTTPFSLANGTIGAVELAARYSDLDLNDNVSDSSKVITGWTGATNRTYTYYNTVRGGDQRAWTIGLNWFPIYNVRVALDYDRINVGREQAPATVTTTGTPALPALSASQTVQAVAVRVQVGF